jgi:hypothetical protein
VFEIIREFIFILKKFFTIQATTEKSYTSTQQQIKKLLYIEKRPLRFTFKPNPNHNFEISVKSKNIDDRVLIRKELIKIELNEDKNRENLQEQKKIFEADSKLKGEDNLQLNKELKVETNPEFEYGIHETILEEKDSGVKFPDNENKQVIQEQREIFEAD